MKTNQCEKTQIDYGMESGTRAEQQTYNIILKLRKMIRMYFYIVELCMQIEFRTWFDFVFVPNRLKVSLVLSQFYLPLVPLLTHNIAFAIFVSLYIC